MADNQADTYQPFDLTPYLLRDRLEKIRRAVEPVVAQAITARLASSEGEMPQADDLEP
ncbi:hypothetical protein [Allosphingosinicella vermicomposti]|uniref:hypothetical protein n=1 Tax=Allosphingosinicella vermicomposti TaxID=614671 RepID=UPI00131A4B92|nr:hypothetical protein [Allosphingosinicella vermicomposti]